MREIVERAGGVSAVLRHVPVSRSTLYAWQQPTGFPVGRRTEALRDLERWAIQQWPEAYPMGFLTGLRTAATLAGNGASTEDPYEGSSGSPPAVEPVDDGAPWPSGLPRSRPPGRLPWALTVLATAAAAIVVVQVAGDEVQVSGTVTCPGDLPVVGVWVRAESGGSGFATSTQLQPASTARFWHRVDGTGPWTVNVGCGGKASDWRHPINGVDFVSGDEQDWTCERAAAQKSAGCHPSSGDLASDSG